MSGSSTRTFSTPLLRGAEQRAARKLRVAGECDRARACTSECRESRGRRQDVEPRRTLDYQYPVTTHEPEHDMTFQLTSSAFKAGGPIPARFTCDAEDVSPPLSWSGAPDGTRSFALIVDDPDAPDPKAPKVVYVHWVVCDIPPSTTSLPEHSGASNLPEGAREGPNDFKNIGYGGPCPPIGRHR